MKAFLTSIHPHPIRNDITNISDEIRKEVTVGYEIDFEIVFGPFRLSGKSTLYTSMHGGILTIEEIETRLLNKLQEHIEIVADDGIAGIYTNKEADEKNAKYKKI